MLSEITWLAGLLEGEGCFLVMVQDPERRRRPVLRVQLHTTDEDVMLHAAEVGESSNGVRVRKQANPKHSDTYAVVWCGAEAERVMRMVLPYMGTRRSAKIRECLDTPNLSHYPTVTA